MNPTLREIAEGVGGVVVGDPDIRITRIREPQNAGPGEIAVVLTKGEASRLRDHDASAVLVAEGVSVGHANQVVVGNGRAAFVALLQLFTNGAKPSGIHPRACIAPDVALADPVTVGPGACIESGARIGAGTSIGANSFVGRNSVIGSGCTIMPNVTICGGTIIGDRVTIHPGTVIGSDGFGFVRLEDGSSRRIPQLGRVEIGDDVEIGANCCIDRATLEATVIGRGTKIDNLVHVGHNSRIGENCCIVAQAGIAGSVEIGPNCVLAGQAGVSDHVTLGPGVRVGAQAGVNRNLASGDWIGSPAMPHEISGRVFAAVEHLPDYRERVRALEARLAELTPPPDNVPPPEGEHE